MSHIVDQFPVANYSTAGQLASVFEQKSRRAIELRNELTQVMKDLNDSFKGDSHKQFNCEISICGAETNIQIAREMKRVAWRTLIERLGMRKIMSTKRIEEMDAALSRSGKSHHDRDSDSVDQLPDVTADSIMDVLSGYAASASEFMTEKVHEVYEYFKPYCNDEYKTNAKNRWKLSQKLIKSYSVESNYSGGFRLSYGKTGDMIQALDSVMHLLDGKGIPSSYHGPLGSSIIESKAKSGETEYFKWKCFQNRNLHLVLKRRDLVDEFNFICGHERELPGKDTGAYQRSSKHHEDIDVDSINNGKFDLFETPESLAVQMCEIAGITQGSEVLEPSAGPGRIVKAATDLGGVVTAVEIQPGLCKHKCYVIESDFMKLTSGSTGLFDAVVMNPPFSNGRDGFHIRHAFDS